MKIGQALKTLLKLRGISQKELSQKIGLSETSISLIVTGETMPRQETLSAICNALEIPVPALFILALDREDLPPNKRAGFDLLHKHLSNLITDIYG